MTFLEIRWMLEVLNQVAGVVHGFYRSSSLSTGQHVSNYLKYLNKGLFRNF